MKEKLANALNENFPVLISSIDQGGQPWQSFYGSTHVFDDESLAFWIRDPQARMIQRIQSNSPVSFIYRNSKEKIIWQFHGNAEIVQDTNLINDIYKGIHPGEQEKDPDQDGCAVLVKINLVLQGSKTLMEL
jgi:general stress protein 26